MCDCFNVSFTTLISYITKVTKQAQTSFLVVVKLFFVNKIAQYDCFNFHNILVITCNALPLYYPYKDTF